MSANSTQGRYRFSIFFALTSFVGCGAFSLFYLYKEKQFAELLVAQDQEIQAIKMPCAAGAGVTSGRTDCDRIHERIAHLHAGRIAKQSYRSKATIWLTLALALPLMSLAASGWWHWVLTGRIFPRRRSRK